MKKAQGTKGLIIVIILILLVVGYYYYLSNRPVEETEEIPEPQPEPPVPEESEPIPEQPAPEVEAETKPAFEWWMIGVALLVFLLGSGGTLLVFNNKHLKKMKLDEEEEETVP